MSSILFVLVRRFFGRRRSAVFLVAVLGAALPAEGRCVAHGELGASGAIGEASVEVSPTSVGVDESSGAATLSIPIDLPPGPNGLQPSLALSYSSQLGNGLLGVGWSIGSPKIACSTRFGLPDYGDCDHYELGGELLVGPEDPGATAQRYHTLDESFTRILKHADHWTQESGAGITNTFGMTSADRVQGGGGTAEWYLSKTRDVYGNEILFEYSSGPAGDEGMLRPSRMTYANATREVRFVYEARPDAISHYSGGIRRHQSERLREIRVYANSQLHHRLLLTYETASSTTQSRLRAIQRFGSDCPISSPDPLNPRPGDACSALPASVFTYTDSGDLSASERWAPQGTFDSPTHRWYAPDSFTTNILNMGVSTQVADIDGDGLPDVIADSPGRSSPAPLTSYEEEVGPHPWQDPTIHINDGKGGWVLSTEWTNRLRGLEFEIARQRVKQVVSGHMPDFQTFASHLGHGHDTNAILETCLESGEATPAVEFVSGGSVQTAGWHENTSPPYYDVTSNRTAYPGAPGGVDAVFYDRGPEVAEDFAAQSEVRPWPHFQFVDLNADGRADMVMSVHLSGYHVSLVDCDSAQPLQSGDEDWIPGETTRVVFINTGDGWALDDGRTEADGNYADSLPPFGIVAFESGGLLYRRLLAENASWMDSEIQSPCDDLGLAGLRESNWATANHDFCLASYDLAPIFEDLNGDGYPDIVVTQTSDPDALFHHQPAAEGYAALPRPQFRSSTTESVAWLQDPNAIGAEPRWVRAEAYDPPYDHALMIQVPGENSGQGAIYAPHAGISRGTPHTANIDKGVRFADLNRDGMADLLFGAVGASQGDFGDQGGVFLNRGASQGSPKHSAWCSSSPVPGVVGCAEDAARYRIPFVFAGFDWDYSAPQHYLISGVGTGLPSGPRVNPRPGGISLVDLNGDGWLDLIEHMADLSVPVGHGLPTKAYIHHPGRAGSVFVEDARYLPPFGDLQMDAATETCNEAYTASGVGVFDANGDGIADFIASEPYCLPDRKSWVSQPGASHSDLLASYADGGGLRVELAYASAVQQRDVDLEADALGHAMAGASPEPLGPDPAAPWPTIREAVDWSTRAVLSSKRVSSPGLSTPAETTYGYAHPRRCLDHEHALGFRLVRANRADASSVRSFYHQAHGRSGQLASRTILDGNDRPLHHHTEDWELPQPSSVEGAWGPGDPSSFAFSFVGRPRATMSRNEYGATIGEAPGFETTISRLYDDVHGYNFVAQTAHDRPGQSYRVESTPEGVDATHFLTGRASRTRTFANEPSDQRLLRMSEFRYLDASGQDTYAKVGVLRRREQSRDAAASGRWVVSSFEYDAFGNLAAKREHEGENASSPGRATEYCYDGDSGCDVGHGSHSVIVGERDALGNWSRSELHPVFAKAERTFSDYTDVPAIQRDFDALGRVVGTGYEAASVFNPVVQLTATKFEDFPTGGYAYQGIFLPYVVHRAFAEPGGRGGTTSISIGPESNAQISIELLGSSTGGTSFDVVGIERSSNPVLRTSSKTEPFPCGQVDPSLPGAEQAAISACLGSAASKTEVVSTRDPLGRLVRFDTPLGFEVADYSAERRAVAGGGGAVPHDVILHKDANGGLVKRIQAAGKSVRILECNNPSLDPSLEDLSGTACLSPDETRVSYEPTGEIRQRDDPTAWTGSGSGPAANQRLRYSYDTLGRVVQIDDPDAGTSTRTYDVYGNLDSATDARGIEVSHQYDAIDRILRTEVPGEAPSQYTYASRQRQLEKLTDGPAVQSYLYDDLGRPSWTLWEGDAPNLRLEVEMDLLGRPSVLSYPTVVNGAIDRIAYDYSGAYTTKVCALGKGDRHCGSSGITDLVSAVVYDGIGRVSEMHFPGGVRRFEYDGNSGRRTRDLFDSLVAGEDIEYVYQDGDAPAYDELGNLTRVDASIGTGGGSHAFGMEYAYDARNRIGSWSYNGVVHDFDYDSRGNLILHAGDVQDYASSETAHAIRSKTVGSTTYSYSYDQSGNLALKRTTGGGDTHYTFDGRGRMTCVGTFLSGCDRLSVQYDGLGQRLRETGSRDYRYAGENFRTIHWESGEDPEYWIEIYALGERIAYKHVEGGAYRIVGLWPGWRPPADVEIVMQIAIFGVGTGILYALLLLVARSDRPARVAASLAATSLASIVPVQAWAGGPTHPYGAGSEAFRWVLTDAIGTSLVELDSAGQRLSYAAYEPFGEVAEESGSGGAGSRAFYAGHDRQSDVGLVYMNARWMSPEAGGFVSVDPLVRDVGDPQTYNGFSYVANNPISRIDPSGAIDISALLRWGDPTADMPAKGEGASGNGTAAVTPGPEGRGGQLNPAGAESADGAGPAPGPFQAGQSGDGDENSRMDSGKWVHGLTLSGGAVASGIGGAEKNALVGGRVTGTDEGWMGLLGFESVSDFAELENDTGAPSSAGFNIGIDASYVLFRGTPRQFQQATVTAFSLLAVEIKTYHFGSGGYFKSFRGLSLGIGPGFGFSSINGRAAISRESIYPVADR